MWYDKFMASNIHAGPCLVLMGRESRRLVLVNRQRTGFDEVCAGVGEGGEVLEVRIVITS